MDDAGAPRPPLDLAGAATWAGAGAATGALLRTLSPRAYGNWQRTSANPAASP